MHRIVCMALLLVALLLTSAQAEEPQVIRIGFSNIGVGNRLFNGFSTVGVMHAQGLLEKELAGTGIKVEWHFHKGAGPAVNEALAEGQLDFAEEGDLPAIIGYAGGLKTRLLAAGAARTTTYLCVPRGSTVQSIRDLKGRTVGNFKGTNLQLAVAKILAANDLTENDIKTVNLNQAGLSAALATKQVDAGFGSFDLLQLRDQGLIEVRYTTKGKSPTLTRQSGFLVTQDFLDKYPEIVTRVVKTLVAASQWASEEKNRAALFETWAKAGISTKYYVEEFAGDELRTRNSPLLDDFFVGRYKDAVARAENFGLLRAPVDVDRWIDRQPLETALKELKLENYWTPFTEDGRPKPT